MKSAKKSRLKNFVSTISLLLVVFIFFTAIDFGLKDKTVPKNKIGIKLRGIPVPFIQNVGIVNKQVAYYAKTFGGSVFITKDGSIIYNLPAKKGGVALKEIFLNSRVTPVVGQQRSLTKVNYFAGNNVKDWKTNIPTFNCVSLGSIYNGIELKLKAYGKKVEKIFYLSPNANVGEIKISFKGAQKIELSKNGKLRVVTKKGDVYFTKPVAYQNVDSKKKYIDVAYVVKGKKYGFKLGKYDKTKPIVIDPLLASTYLGGSDGDYSYALALDSSGNVYVAGTTYSSDFPTIAGAYDESYNDNNSSDVFVSKLSPDLHTLITSTYLGGSANDYAYSIALDNLSNVYITGETDSDNFPTTTGAYDNTSNGGYDVFISKFNDNLSKLLASTYLGGSDNETGRSIALDNLSNVYITGETDSDNFPTTTGAYDNTSNGLSDVFVSKLDDNLSTLLASTYLGGSDNETGRSIALDSSANVYITGETDSDNFPTTTGAYDNTSNGLSDVFVSKLDDNLSNILASTYLGGNNGETGLSLAFDSLNNVYVAGVTSSTGLGTPNAIQENLSGSEYFGDGFVAKFNNNLNTLFAFTYLGGSDDDGFLDMLIDSQDNIYLVGTTDSSDFPVTTNAYDISNQDSNISSVICKMNSSLNTLLASTYFKGTQDSGETWGYSIALDKYNNVYISGYTYNTTLPTTSNTYEKTYNGGGDAYIAKFDKDLSANPISINPQTQASGGGGCTTSTKNSLGLILILLAVTLFALFKKTSRIQVGR